MKKIYALIIFASFIYSAYGQAFSVSPQSANKGKRVVFTFSGGGGVYFRQGSQTCPYLSKDVYLTIFQATGTQATGTQTSCTQISSSLYACNQASGTRYSLYPASSSIQSSSTLSATFDILNYLPSGFYDIVLGSGTSCQTSFLQRIEIIDTTVNSTPVTVNNPTASSTIVQDGIKVNNTRNIEVTVYPNPASDLLSVCIGNESPENLECNITNLKGKLLYTRKIKSSCEIFDISSVSPGVYVVKVLKNKQLIKTSKVLKLK